MANTPVNIEDFTCSICRDIFSDPVSLSCPHTYCRLCVYGLKKSSSWPNDKQSSAISSLRPESLTHSSHHHQPDQIFVCAICRQESFGYVRFQQMSEQLRRLTTQCPSCSEFFTLSQLRTHSEKCLTKKPIGFQPQLKNLSASQATALQKARDGENRSTFTCPFCHRMNFSVTHLRQHIHKRHRQDNQAKVCPICASLPWGDRSMVTSNLSQHLKTRHKFDYDTYVNYDLDEDTMLQQAIRDSLFDQ